MEEFKIDKDYKVINGNSLEVLDTLPECSVDAIVCDPPYELGFMGKKWDSTGIAYNVELWKKALRVLKKGGYLLAFGGSRTFHRVACAIEDAGFEIRDTIMWLYGCGFPKSHNIGLAIDIKRGNESKVIGTTNCPNTKYSGEGKLSFGQNENSLPRVIRENKVAVNEWAGWGTCLKPAFEPIVMARKPTNLTITENCEIHGVGGINIDECRVPTNEKRTGGRSDGRVNVGVTGFVGKAGVVYENGRFPSNVITDGSDEVAQGMPETGGAGGSVPNVHITGYGENIGNGKTDYTKGDRIPYESGSGNAIRYFYSAKASKKDRDNGLDEFEAKACGSIAGGENEREDIDDVSKRFRTVKRNDHATVKPVELMQYLVRLVSPKGATVLDIFNGSGSTGKAVAFENRERNANYKYIGIELDRHYCEISIARIHHALYEYEYELKKEFKRTGQLSLFDDFLEDE